MVPAVMDLNPERIEMPIKQTYVLEDELHGHSFLNSCFTFMLIDFKCVHC